jgi:hypothetical protein
MVIGILWILFLALLSALTSAIPLFIVLIGISMFITMTSNLKARNFRLERVLELTMTPLSTYAGAVAQLAIWQLEPGHDRLKWVMAGFIYVLGMLVAMFIVAMKSKTPFMRSYWVNLYSLSGLIMLALLAACFHSPDVFTFLERSPAKVSTFIFGGSAK